MKPRPSFAADFDKLFYNPGDTIKATITARSENGEPLYAEVEAILREGDKKLGEAQSVTDRDGKAKIDFALQSSGKGLHVVAHIKYTDKEKTLRFPVPHKTGSPVQFNTFPEGGSLVAGIPCKLACKAVNIDGEPLEIAEISLQPCKLQGNIKYDSNPAVSLAVTKLNSIDEYDNPVLMITKLKELPF